MHRILLIDDDEHLAGPLRTYFHRHDLDLDAVTRPSAALPLLRDLTYDLAILDVMLPEMDGFQVCREIRRFSDIPILMLTARGDVMDRVVGIELGADDYLPKPFEPRELLVRMQAILRRTRPASLRLGVATVLNFDGLQIDLERHEARRDGQVIELTSMEFGLLALLAKMPGRVFTREEILEQLRGQSADDLVTRAVDILVSRLRKKLEPLDCIKTLRNAGYRFAAGRVE
jgi:two-component system OmpR family response regulator